VELGAKLKSGDIVYLNGDMGTGKTEFTKGIAKGLEVEDYVVSPTFTIVNEYTGRCPLYHFDVYRLNGYSEFEDLGYEEYFAGDGVVVIEWAEKIAKLIPRDSIFINFEYVDENSRKMIIRGLKSRLNELVIDKKMEVG